MEVAIEGGGSPSFNNTLSSSNERIWSRQQKRAYHRFLSLLRYWQAHGYQVLWVMLSTAEGGDGKSLAYNHQILRQRIERKLKYKRLEHCQVRTSEGHGVLHVLWAWRSSPGERGRSFYVGQKWLSEQWEEIHGAKVVWIKRMKLGAGSRRKVSKYCVTQYCAEQEGFEYMSWSWGRTFGFPLVAMWRSFKAMWKEVNGSDRKKAMYLWWEAFLGGQPLPVGGGLLRLEGVKCAYQRIGLEAFEGLSGR